MTANNAINNTLQSPFNVGATSVTSTGTQLNYLNALTAVPINKINVQVFTGSGTYTRTAGTVYGIIEVQAGGGGGGGVVSTTGAQNCIATGGGSGAYSSGFYDAATMGTGITITIGGGGTAGSNSGGDGGDGGTSSFGTLIVCTGGTHGLGNASATGGFKNKGGAPGAATTAGNIISVVGQYGGTGVGTGGTGRNATGGGSFLGRGGSTLGAPATSYTSSGDTAITNAQNYGAGGAGAISVAGGAASVGGTGSGGIIIVHEFLSS